MSKQRTRLMDIAAHAGVSTATVSRVINRTGPVSAETRHRVLTAIDTLGYERPLSERSGSTPLIGIITPELTNPAFAAYAHHIQVEVARAGAVPLIGTQTPGTTSEEEHVTTFLNSGVAGLVFVSGRHADYRADLSRYHRLLASRIPFVTINGAREELECVDYSTADGLGIEAAILHLRELGHSRIALLSGRSHIVPARRKLEAFERSMLEFFPDFEPLMVETFYTYEAGAAAAGDLINRGATAIITGSDVQALGAIRTIRSMGLSVPGDVSVIGFDDAMMTNHLEPPLTSIRQPIADISSAAVQALLAQISGTDIDPNSFVFTPDLIVRSSTGRVKQR